MSAPLRVSDYVDAASVVRIGETHVLGAAHAVWFVYGGVRYPSVAAALTAAGAAAVRDVLAARFAADPEPLLRTRSRRLVYESRDATWGAGATGGGLNAYGDALMDVRERLRGSRRRQTSIVDYFSAPAAAGEAAEK